ncbi:MAG TPA: HAMP domain-containing sensor histidine kinase [Gaiellaceae bacterium]|jgi:signal transduction histidine kinase|nr:HAMP domain-containing sensor histidine kinase [Gaiellaceae bacterium]
MPENAAQLRLPEPAAEASDEQLVRTAKLAALGQLVRGAAHEINNPLFGILGLVEFLLNEVEPGTKVHERVQLIEASGQDVKRIVQALLGFAREHPQHEGPVGLEQTAAGAVELLRCTNSAKTVELRESYGPEPLPVDGSAHRLAQLFLHLLLNAQEAVNGGGSITVALAREGDWAMARVSDTGPGFRPDAAARAFEPWFTTKREPLSAGLGLAAARQIAREHGGDLVVLPADGRGTTVVLRLPIAGAAS